MIEIFVEMRVIGGGIIRLREAQDSPELEN
jgi:hypothetical protein